jgi:hypothetical protein
MPPPDAILSWASAVANQWRPLAIIWHVVALVFLVAALTGWCPSARSIGRLLVLPFASVSVIAWASGNPFNAIAFATLVAGLTVGFARLATCTLKRSPTLWFAAGILLTIFGVWYPHFLETGGWAAYLYAAPFGLLPCPTLSAVIGITLMFSALQSTAWTVPLVLAGFLYGAIGVFRLGVTLDAGLLAGSTLLALSISRRGTASLRRAIDRHHSRTAVSHAR